MATLKCRAEPDLICSCFDSNRRSDLRPGIRPRIDKPICTNLLYCLPPLTVRQLRYRFSGTAFPTCRVRRTELALRQRNAEADA
jgi:hypothetical protein